MFGILTMHLARLVNYGHSYQGAEEIYRLLRRFPLQYSEFHLFSPQRNLLIWPKPKQNTTLKQFYLVEYDRESQEASAKYHSGHGTSIMFDTHTKEGLKKRGARTATNMNMNTRDVVSTCNGKNTILEHEFQSFLC